MFKATAARSSGCLSASQQAVATTLNCGGCTCVESSNAVAGRRQSVKIICILLLHRSECGKGHRSRADVAPSMHPLQFVAAQCQLKVMYKNTLQQNCHQSSRCCSISNLQMCDGLKHRKVRCLLHQRQPWPDSWQWRAALLGAD